ncbi:secretion protein snm4 [Catenulispora acidiphila DSM 44928]|uniref:Secretion protein snm4 n=1 Tax=Catenulispora acidiphila (strain DSM 44928 / JCM 14897 / NBRC 102108 / NRRL B-24433 / ID139908) TaxID=479433 RepID=C7QFC9_CATAD|nr:EsaB/YukD family protein [Catenulispora acidiphila]ACU76706.1 secretion protein snm4 [Catenulispora acidiphila DSM 44928]
MTAGSGVAGHCRVTVVAPTRRVDVALPEDVPLAELLPELLRLVGDPLPTPAALAAALTGYVLTGADGVPLDTAASLTDQGVLHGGVLRLRPADDVPEAAVHDDIADVVAEAVIAGGSQWTTAALRATALAVVTVASTLGAVVLWFSNTGTFHGWKGIVAGVITLVLFGLAIRQARYDQSAVGRGSYYGYGDGAGAGAPSGPPQGSRRNRGHDRVNQPDADSAYGRDRSPYDREYGEPTGDNGYSSHGYSSDDPDPSFADTTVSFDLASFASEAPDPRRTAARSLSGTTATGVPPRSLGGATATRAAHSVRDGGLGSLAAWPTVAEAMAWATGAHHQRDYTAAAVLAASSLPYAFIAGTGLLPTDASAGHGFGRAHFLAGAVTVLVMAIAAIFGLGRRIAVPVAGATVGLVATFAGIGLLLIKASPAAGIAIVAAVCALAIEVLPFAAMAVARFVIEPPTSGVEPGDFEGSPVNNYVVGLRVARTLDVLTGLTAGIGMLLVLCVALLVIPIGAMQTAPEDQHTVWEQALAILVSGVTLCRARLFRERAQVLAVAVSGLIGLVIAFSAMSANAVPNLRAMWLAPLLVVISLLALGLASIRPRRGTSEPIMPPRWARAVDMVEGAVFLAVLPVLMAVLGVYGQVRNLKG